MSAGAAEAAASRARLAWTVAAQALAGVAGVALVVAVAGPPTHCDPEFPLAPMYQASVGVAAGRTRAVPAEGLDLLHIGKQ